MKKLIWILAATAVVGSVTVFAVRLNRPDTVWSAQPAAAGLVVVRDVRLLMGTAWEITVATRNGSRQAVSAIVDEAFAEIARVDQALSDWRDGTELNEVNRHAGIRPVVVSEDTFDVVERACHFSQVSDGAFDITFNVMWGVWDFKNQHPDLPDPGVIDKRIALIDYRNVILDPERRTIFLRHSGMKIGLGGIGKGYAADRVCALLEKHGLKDYIVSGGGDMRISGSRGPAPWRLGVQHPRKQDLLYLLDMTNVAVATSGDYERYFILDGKRYHHILDPKTGYPARGVCSVTIIAPQATDADALATCAFILGVEKGLKLLEALPDVEGIIIDTDLHTAMTDGLMVLHDESGGIPRIRFAQTSRRLTAR